VRAEVWIRAVAPNGQFGDGDGYCSADEGRFRGWKGRQKLENDLRATATTRAKNRAIADLVGMGEVSAEEIAPAGEEEEHAQALAAGAPASAELARVAFAALARLLGDGEPDPQGPGGSASGSPPTTAICRWPWAARCATRPRRLGTRGRPVAVAKRTRGRSGRRTGHSRRAGLAVGRRRVGVLAQKGRYGATSSRLRQRLSVARAQSSGSRRSSSPNSDSCSSARSAAG
jgi:hypothetical protein